MKDIKYIGEELGIFARATNWKSYYASLIKPHLGQRVLEVGAGLGATTPALHDPSVREWVCLEPDESFYKLLDEKINSGELPAGCKAVHGTLASLPEDDLYDAILYIDVMEHIEDDHAEARIAGRHLKLDGHLIVLSPAHQWLFTAFDHSIGHFRRYSRTRLAQITPINCTVHKLIYLDSAGMLLSTANKLFLRQSMPTLEQILFWDQFVVPVSKILDRLFSFNLGKSVVGIWRRTG